LLQQVFVRHDATCRLQCGHYWHTGNQQTA